MKSESTQPDPANPSRRAAGGRAVRAQQSQILREAIGAIGHPRGSGPRKVIFDLDSTLLDNRPRQARIVREFAQANGETRLVDCPPERIVSWDLRDTARLCGYSQEEAEAIYPAFKEFWRQRFFTSEYCADDVAIPGAREFLQAVLGAGGRLIYVTGRHLGMGEGTIESFRRAGFPLPKWPLGPGHLASEEPAQLWLKSDPAQDDDLWKESCYLELLAQGGIAAAFDNEPTHINGYQQRFSEARVIHLETDHSGRDVLLIETIPSIADFAMDPES